MTPTSHDASNDEDPVATLQRWQNAGAVWRVIARHPHRVTVGLYTCSGGEEVDRFTSSNPHLLRFLGDQSASNT
jgi:hypothetical protein